MNLKELAQETIKSLLEAVGNFDEEKVTHLEFDHLVNHMLKVFERVQKETMAARIEWPTFDEVLDEIDNSKRKPVNKSEYKAGFLNACRWLSDNIRIAPGEDLNNV